MLNNMKISTRLLMMLGLLIVVMIVLGVMGIYSLNESNLSSQSLYDNNLIPIQQLSGIARLSLKNQIAISHAVIEPEHMADYIKEINGDLDQNNKLWNAYMATHLQDEEKRLAETLKERRDQFIGEGIKPVLAAMKTGSPAAVKTVEINTVRPLFGPFETALDEQIKFQVRDAKAANTANEHSYKTVRMIFISLLLAGIALSGALGLFIIRSINRAVGELRGTMMRMAANGDLNQRSKVYGNDEIGQTATAFNGLIEGFAGIIRKVIEGVVTVSSTAAQLSVASTQIASGSQAQSEAAASTAAAVEQITVSINSVASNTQDVRELSEQSLSQTKQGNQSVTEMITEIGNVQTAVTEIADSVKEFVGSTRAIAGMTQQVKDIADQTNLLALNAAIEAARAGEQGRGFAVVADEVRKLAEKSAKSANEIDQVTNSLNQKSASVEAVVQTGLSSLQATQEQVGRVSVMLTEAGDAVTKSSHGVNDIAASVNEQSIASTEIARNVEKIAQMSEENSAAVKSNSQEIKGLENLANELQAAVGKFKV
jgi:methyl-accepting chemotaxis protein